MLISERQCIIPISPTCAYGIALFQYVPRVPMALYYSSIPTCVYGTDYSGIPTCAYGTALFQYSYMCLWHCIIPVFLHVPMALNFT